MVGKAWLGVGVEPGASIPYLPAGTCPKGPHHSLSQEAVHTTLPPPPPGTCHIIQASAAATQPPPPGPLRFGVSGAPRYVPMCALPPSLAAACLPPAAKPTTTTRRSGRPCSRRPSCWWSCCPRWASAWPGHRTATRCSRWGSAPGWGSGSREHGGGLHAGLQRRAYTCQWSPPASPAAVPPYACLQLYGGQALIAERAWRWNPSDSRCGGCPATA